MENSYRIHTNITGDTLLNVSMKQDFDFLEILSLKLRQKDAYRLHSSNYGVVVGRVLANDAFGIPNAKVSVFIERESSDPVELRTIYPYSEIMSKDSKGRRYNLLPDYSDDSCYRVVGTFPRKRYLLDDNIQLEIYEKYWKYTTVTNQAGDYMLFGVPEGSQQIHVDIDLSDIGILSQKPRDFIYKGYNLDEFDSPSQFKESANIDGLAQIISQNKATVVYPFWGDADNGIAAITRCDVQVNYKFEPTCVFMGAIVSDNDANAIGHKCAPDIDSGLNSQLVAGEGRIEMIRKTSDGLVEEFPIKGNALIDNDGVWCYQIPMNLDYIGTDEYGNIVATDNPSKGIPTRAQVRFRISKTETGEEGFSRHTAKYLVPMNPILSEERDNEVPKTIENGIEMEHMYNFGSNTPQSCFRDLYWNNVYSVKNFIPKVQVAHRPYSKNYGALKGSNLVDNQNPIPFNKLRIDMPFSYMIVCIIFTIVMYIVMFLNFIIYILMEIRDWTLVSIFGIKIKPFSLLPKLECLPLNSGIGENDNVAYYPGCECPGSAACRYSDCPEDMENGCEKKSDSEELLDKTQQALAQDYKIIKLDFYQDWINGTLYMPLWFWRKRKKKTFLFFTISGAKNEFCSCDKSYSRLKTYVTCNIDYTNNSFGTSSSINNGEKWHKTQTGIVRFLNGLIKPVENKDGLTAYYYSAFQASADDPIEAEMKKRTKPFEVVILYATDIILLGNLNDDNIYGIPQFFKVLPSTTANIPPIATIQENNSEKGINEAKNDDIETISNVEDSGSTITTGMDWGHDGGDQTPTYKNGLFMDLACTYARTMAKSCINVERLSELGVNLDATYDMSYAQSSAGLKIGKMDSDGFINKLELDDLDNRATFATLNHIGFVPQDYQDKIGAYSTQVTDENTMYLVPKFKYIYPVDFDGRLKYPMMNYKKSFNQGLYDELDESYVTFRLGAEKAKNKEDNLEQRVRHFYKRNGSKYSMPLYRNSFYFYFGINKGSTAIDKFNKMFYTECTQNDKKPFSFIITSQGKSYCPSTYDTRKLSECRGVPESQIDNTGYNGYAYIRFTSDDIITPFSYTLYDSFGNAVIPTESDMNTTDFVIGGIINDEGEMEMNEKGQLLSQMPDKITKKYKSYSNGVYKDGLTNQTYILEVVDGNGKKLSERIELKTPKISLEYETTPLGAKFYTTASTRMDYICNSEYELYGTIRILSFKVDGYEFYITESNPISYDPMIDAYEILLRGVAGERNQNAKDKKDKFIKMYCASAILRVSVVNTNEVGWVRDCLCDVENRIFNINGKESYIKDTITDYWFGLRSPIEDDIVPGLEDEQVIPTIFVYQPNRFNLSITQLCEIEGVEKEIEENTTSEIATVVNGENFNVYLNTMPVRFMLGTTTDNINAEVSSKSRFYNVNVVTDPKDEHISGWYGVHEEPTYRWDMSENMVLNRNQEMWEDFVNLERSVSDHRSKVRILKYKFSTMFALSDGVYVHEQNQELKFTAKGGNGKLLYRDVAPNYKDSDTFVTLYRLADENVIMPIKEYPNIIGSNYNLTKAKRIQILNFYLDFNVSIVDYNQGPKFNWKYNASEKLGNYFAVFTNNGGYTSRTEVSTSSNVMKIPNYAKVTPWKRPNKKLGDEEFGSISMFEPAYNSGGVGRDKYLPYLRTLTVDRRLDHDFIIFAPSSSDGNTNLYPKVPRNTLPDYDPSLKPKDADEKWDTELCENPKDKVWKYARISGITFGGIEMSYDTDYNIISADTTAFYYAPSIDENAIFENYETALEFVAESLDISIEDAHEYVEEYKDVTATPNHRLEYSYNFSDLDEDAKTYYNSETDMIWEEDAYDTYKRDDEGNIVFDNEGNPIVIKKGDKNGQILKRLYEAEFMGSDIREFFWSDFNRTRLKKYTDDETGFTTTIDRVSVTYHPIACTINYVYKYPYSSNNLYNGDFNRRNVLNNYYPTRRYIDIGNVVPGASYKLELKDCTYNTKVNSDERSRIYANIEGDEGLSLNISFGSPITFIGPDSNSDDYANALYTGMLNNTTFNYNVAGQETTSWVYKKFSSDEGRLAFIINPIVNDDYYVYAAFPKVITVMPFKKGKNGEDWDGISYIKTMTSDGEVCATGDLAEEVIDSVTFYEFRHISDDDWTNLSNSDDTFVPTGVWRDVMTLKSGEETRSYYYYLENTNPKTFLTSDSTTFQSIMFRSPSFSFVKNKVKMFAVCVERTYICKEDDFLTKGLKVFEFSDIYDVRDIFVRINTSSFTNEGKTDYYTYIQKIKSSSHTRTEEKKEKDEDGKDKEVTETTTDENFTHVQVITFDMYFPDEKNPLNMACEAFSNTNMMSFQFKFTNKAGDIYPIEPFEVKGIMIQYDKDGKVKKPAPGEEPPSKGKIVRVKVRWLQDMGVLADENWGSATNVEITARKNDGFVYKLSSFHLCGIKQDGGYDPKTGESTGLNEGDKGNTTVNIC